MVIIKNKKLKQLIPQVGLRKLKRQLHIPSWLLDRVLPHHCPICFVEIGQNGLCADCWQRLAFITDPYCKKCGKPLHAHGLVQLCGACLQDKSHLCRTRSAIHYDDMARALILPFKHGDRLDLAPLIARFMRPAFEELVTDDHLILPIPLHLWRRIGRRYNQSAEIARHLTFLTNREAQLSTTLLRRAHYTPSLAKHNARKRQAILKDAFCVTLPAGIDLSKRPILLIDDVITTGATMHAASLALRKAGARHIDQLSFARIL